MTPLLDRGSERPGSAAVAIAVLLTLAPTPAGAQPTPPGEPCQDVGEFDVAVTRAFEEAVLTTPRGADSASGYARRVIAAYKDRLVTLDSRRWFDVLLRCFVAEHLPESSQARSASSSTNNPQATSLIERSGFTDLLSLALDGQNVVAADENAVTVNLNALALRGHTDTFSSLARFREAATWRRIGGSFTFGGKLPEKDLVGFSGFPGADELFDAISWDVRVRLVGDRDPRATRWEGLLARVSLAANQASAAQGTLGRLHVEDALPVGTFGALSEAINEEFLGPEADKAAQELAHSWQVTLKAAGQHLTRKEGANKLSFSLLADRGVGAWDLTLNATYSRSHPGGDQNQSGTMPAVAASGDVVDTTALSIQRIENLELNLGLTRTLLHGFFQERRGAELTVSGRAVVPLAESFVDSSALPGSGTEMRRHTVWKGNLTLSFPLGESGKIPVSVTYTNDPDALSKVNYVEGRIGVSWDFGALAKQLKKLEGP